MRFFISTLFVASISMTALGVCVSDGEELLHNEKLLKVVASMGGLSQLAGIWDHPWSAKAVVFEDSTEGFSANIRGEGAKLIEICDVPNNPQAAIVKYREPASANSPTVLVQAAAANRLAVSVNGGAKVILTRRNNLPPNFATTGADAKVRPSAATSGAH